MRKLALTALCLGLLSSPALAANTPDYSLYAQLLAAHVKNGVVDYAGFKSHEAELDEALALMSTVRPEELSRNQAMAFYINAYNAWTIKLILKYYPGIESIKDAGGFLSSPWKKKFVELHGLLVSLDYIEHEVLRPKYKDPRVHFAINCASKSCPPLLAEPYVGDKLEAQLEAVTRAFINDPESNFVKDGRLHVSRIFKWFGGDFNDDPAGFVSRYAQGELKQSLEALGPGPKVSYLDYDWSLNGK